MIAIYLTSATARAWLRDWDQRFRAAVLLADVVPDELLIGTTLLE